MSPSIEKSPSRAGRSRVRAAALAFSALFTTLACGGSRADSKTAAEPPQQQQQPGGADEESRAHGQPAPAESAPAPAPEAPSSTDRERTYMAVDDIEALGRSLERTLRLSVPDCSSAASLRDRICDLATRICDIAARSAEAEMAERCTDGRRRCERATASVRTTCPE